MAAKVNTGEKALDAAMAAGFEITEHGRVDGRYRHQMTHSDGRALAIDTELGTGRFVLAVGRNRSRWNATYLAARNLTALRDLLGAGGKAPEQMCEVRIERRHSELSEQHAWALENERRIRNDIRRERRQLFGR